MYVIIQCSEYRLSNTQFWLERRSAFYRYHPSLNFVKTERQSEKRRVRSLLGEEYKCWPTNRGGRRATWIALLIPTHSRTPINNLINMWNFSIKFLFKPHFLELTISFIFFNTKWAFKLKNYVRFVKIALNMCELTCTTCSRSCINECTFFFFFNFHTLD